MEEGDLTSCVHIVAFVLEIEQMFQAQLRQLSPLGQVAHALCEMYVFIR